MHLVLYNILCVNFTATNTAFGTDLTGILAAVGAIITAVTCYILTYTFCRVRHRKSTGKYTSLE